MRLMLAVHGFPPAAGGGTEIYVHDLARCLRDDFGDDVLVLAREADAARPELAVRREEREGLRLVFVNNTFRAGRSFADTYRNAAITELAARVAEEFSPDAVHVHHLTGLSTDLVGALAAAGLPVIVTLNDYWLTLRYDESKTAINAQPVDVRHVEHGHAGVAHVGVQGAVAGRERDCGDSEGEGGDGDDDDSSEGVEVGEAQGHSGLLVDVAARVGEGDIASALGVVVEEEWLG